MAKKNKVILSSVGRLRPDRYVFAWKVTHEGAESCMRGWRVKKRKSTRMCSYALKNEKYFRACGGGNHKMRRAAATAAAVRALLDQMQLWKATRNVCNWDRWPVVLSRLHAFKRETEKESVASLFTRVHAGPRMLLWYALAFYFVRAPYIWRIGS